MSICTNLRLQHETSRGFEHLVDFFEEPHDACIAVVQMNPLRRAETVVFKVFKKRKEEDREKKKEERRREERDHQKGELHVSKGGKKFKFFIFRKQCFTLTSPQPHQHN
jgi:hypothetical protein